MAFARVPLRPSIPTHLVLRVAGPSAAPPRPGQTCRRTAVPCLGMPGNARSGVRRSTGSPVARLVAWAPGPGFHGPDARGPACLRSFASGCEACLFSLANGSARRKRQGGFCAAGLTTWSAVAWETSRCGCPGADSLDDGSAGRLLGAQDRGRPCGESRTPTQQPPADDRLESRSHSPALTRARRSSDPSHSGTRAG